ncbi:hypothetical protein TIFTF001_034011 [Ficus carica]|uniref:Uncharacterized protein n=1 Tax=Ficus carica TaxID=3494 RepID=A0AA88JA54_FICCA|nr:hypothetical protein TIFTF001_034011 [Ficus carica]
MGVIEATSGPSTSAEVALSVSEVTSELSASIEAIIGWPRPSACPVTRSRPFWVIILGTLSCSTKAVRGLAKAVRGLAKATSVPTGSGEAVMGMAVATSAPSASTEVVMGGAEASSVPSVTT